MTRRVLIVGINPYDSGKTRVSEQLVSHLQSLGQKVEYFKPMSGHNFWYRYNHSQHCLNYGSVYSYDAASVRKLYTSKHPIQMTNPVHRLVAPIRLQSPDQRIYNTLGLGGLDSVFALERITSVNEGKISSAFLAAQTLIENNQLILSPEESDRLVGNNRRINVESLEEIQDFERSHFDKAVQSCFTLLEEDADLVIIESFNDTVWPWSGLDRVDLVLAVRPGQAFMYSPERFQKAVDAIDNNKGRVREITTSKISEYLNPIEEFDIKPVQGLRDADIIEIMRMFGKG